VISGAMPQRCALMRARGASARMRSAAARRTRALLICHALPTPPFSRQVIDFSFLSSSLSFFFIFPLVFRFSRLYYFRCCRQFSPRRCLPVFHYAIYAMPLLRRAFAILRYAAFAMMLIY
jgi:hypothetical protein